MATHDEAQDPAEWLAGPLGRYLLAREQAFFDGVVADVFGYNAFQLGMPQVDLLRASRMSMRCRVGRDDAAALRADFQDLPVAGGSADLVLLPHTLEFTDYPHQILREVARALRPEGHVIIAGFNPWSLWGARRVFGRKQRYPWSGRFINLPRMKDWLALLGFEISGGQMACYVPPCASQKWLDRVAFMEAAGDRWWPIAGGVYFLQAVKRVNAMRLIMPRWSDRLVPANSLAAAPKKVAQPEDALVARNSMNGDR
jgi:SAM-dependent methyltransferase